MNPFKQPGVRLPSAANTRELPEYSAAERLSPLSKAAATLIFIMAVLSFGKYEFWRLIPFFAFPISAAEYCGLSLRLLIKRAAFALPFLLCLTLGGMFFEDSASAGLLFSLTILSKALLCVIAALVFSATTPAGDLISLMLALKIPFPIVLQAAITWRYIEDFSNAASNAAKAYSLRAPKSGALKLKHWSGILGSLFFRAIDKSERICAAMLCRGLNPNSPISNKIKISKNELFALALFALSLAILRIFDFSSMEIRL